MTKLKKYTDQYTYSKKIWQKQNKDYAKMDKILLSNEQIHTQIPTVKSWLNQRKIKTNYW